MKPLARVTYRTSALAVYLLIAGTMSVAIAQYPLAPTPVLELRRLSREPRLSGYVSVRETLRDDTSTFVLNRARIAVQVLPVSYAALRLQVDLSAAGTTSGDTVPPFSLTDAYVQIAFEDSAGVIRRLRPALIVGQFRTPFSLEFLTPFSLLVTANRSQAVDRLGKRRDLGVLGQVRFASLVTLTGAVVNGEGPNRIGNSDGHQMAVGRLTVTPRPGTEVSGKWLRQGGDQGWGYDVRWLVDDLIFEGEAIRREAQASGPGVGCGAGGYVLAAYKVTPWLQPVVKWERLRESSCSETSITRSRLTWATYGVNFLSPDGRLRLQLDWIVKRERPVARSNELVAQLQAIF